MDPVQNPFAPGAGSRPPQLAGRGAIIEGASIALRRVKAGRHARSQMLLGLRGVGKTVLLNLIAEIADDEGYLWSLIEAPEGRSLPELLTPQLRVLLFRLSAVEKARVLTNRAMATLRSFAGVFRISYGDFEIGVEADPDVAASGDLESDLSNVMYTVAQAAQAAERPVAILIDELQYLRSEDLAALIVSLHRIAQRGLPLIVFGAGLPQLAGVAGGAKSYAERLFDFTTVGPLNEAESRAAVSEPIREAGARITARALKRIVERTEGYPYFLQQWGYHSWAVATRSPIDLAQVETASARAIESLDAGFFRVRYERLTPREQEYLRAMAELGAGPHRSGAIAAVLNTTVGVTGSLRTGLIRKGMIFSPSHGDTAFTVPMFDGFMKRAMPIWVRPSRKRRGRTQS